MAEAGNFAGRGTEWLETELEYDFSVNDDAWGALHVTGGATAAYHLMPQTGHIVGGAGFRRSRYGFQLPPANVVVCSPDEMRSWYGEGEHADKFGGAVAAINLVESRSLTTVISVPHEDRLTPDMALQSVDPAYAADAVRGNALVAHVIAATAGRDTGNSAKMWSEGNSDIMARRRNALIPALGFAGAAVAVGISLVTSGELEAKDTIIPAAFLVGAYVKQQSVLGRHFRSAPERRALVTARSVQRGGMVMRSVHDALCPIDHKPAASDEG